MSLVLGQLPKKLNTHLQPKYREIKDSTWLRRIVFSLIAILFLWPSYGEWKIAGIPNIAPPRILKILLYIIIIYNFSTIGINFNRIKKRISDNKIIFICLFTFNIIQFTTFALDVNGSYWIYYYIKEILAGNILILFALLLVLRNTDDVIALFKVLVYSSMIVTVISIIELITKQNVFSLIVSNANISTVMALTDKTRDSGYRVSASFIHPLVLAHYSTCLFPIAIFLINKSTGISRVVFAIACIGIITNIILSSTRSGFVILSGAATIIFIYLYTDWWRGNKDKIIKMLTLIPIVLLAAFASFSMKYWILLLMQGRTHEERSSTLVRIGEIESSIPKILDSILIGYGPTNATTGVGLNRTFGSVVDNYYLLVSLQSGLIATVLLIICLLIPAKNIVKEIFNKLAYSMKPLAAIAISMSIFFIFQAIHALTDLLVLFYILIACFAVLNCSKH